MLEARRRRGQFRQTTLKPLEEHSPTSLQAQYKPHNDQKYKYINTHTETWKESNITVIIHVYSYTERERGGGGRGQFRYTAA